MTTVAFDGKTLAADSAAGGHFRRFGVQKLFALKNGAILAGTGAYQDVLLVKDWLEDDADPSNKPVLDDDTCVLVVRKGKAVRMENHLRPFPVKAPYAIGSGCEFAMGAMLAGATARQAVKIASRLDYGSGGAVQCRPVKRKERSSPSVSERQRRTAGRELGLRRSGKVKRQNKGRETRAFGSATLKQLKEFASEPVRPKR